MGPQTFVRGALFLAAAMAQDSGALHIQYNIEMTGGISARGPAVKDRIIYRGSCAQPPTPIHIWGVKVARIQVAFNVLLAGSGYFKFSNWKNATGKLEDGTISRTCKQEKR